MNEWVKYKSGYGLNRPAASTKRERIRIETRLTISQRGKYWLPATTRETQINTETQSAVQHIAYFNPARGERGGKCYMSSFQNANYVFSTYSRYFPQRDKIAAICRYAILLFRYYYCHHT